MAESVVDEAVSQCRNVRSHYVALQNRITEDKDEIACGDSAKFMTIFTQVENLHQHVNKPREQVADAEALLGLTTSLVASVKSHTIGGITPSEFISCLLRDFEQWGRKTPKSENAKSSIHWKDLGLVVSPIFMNGIACMTMLGPMSNELKDRKVIVQRKCTKLMASSRPEELDDAAEKKTDTDKNIVAMFEILKEKKTVKLENLMLNRKSFAQTVENLFALSFLVKDGRVEVNVDEKGSQIVSPRNAPASNKISSGEAKYHHFAFRFDYNDWKLMRDLVPEGEELMPHRQVLENSFDSQPKSVPEDAQAAAAALHTTPVKILSRNRSLLLQENSGFEKTAENGEETSSVSRRCKRKLL